MKIEIERNLKIRTDGLERLTQGNTYSMVDIRENCTHYNDYGRTGEHWFANSNFHYLIDVQGQYGTILEIYKKNENKQTTTLENL